MHHHLFQGAGWIAGSRSTFGRHAGPRFILAPLMLGFSQTIILWYLVFVTLHALGLTAIRSQRNGSKSSWLCPDSSLDHTSQKESSTRTLRSIFRGSIRFRYLLFPENAERLRPVGEEISLTFWQTIEPLCRGKRRPKNLVHQWNHPWETSAPLGVAFTRQIFMTLTVKNPKSYSDSRGLAAKGRIVVRLFAAGAEGPVTAQSPCSSRCLLRRDTAGIQSLACGVQ